MASPARCPPMTRNAPPSEWRKVESEGASRTALPNAAAASSCLPSCCSICPLTYHPRGASGKRKLARLAHASASLLLRGSPCLHLLCAVSRSVSSVALASAIEQASPSAWTACAFRRSCVRLGRTRQGGQEHPPAPAQVCSPRETPAPFPPVPRHSSCLWSWPTGSFGACALPQRGEDGGEAGVDLMLGLKARDHGGSTIARGPPRSRDRQRRGAAEAPACFSHLASARPACPRKATRHSSTSQRGAKLRMLPWRRIGGKG